MLFRTSEAVPLQREMLQVKQVNTYNNVFIGRYLLRVQPSSAHFTIFSAFASDCILQLAASLVFKVRDITLMLSIYINVLQIFCCNSIAKELCNLLERFSTLVIVSA